MAACSSPLAVDESRCGPVLAQPILLVGASACKRVEANRRAARQTARRAGGPVAGSRASLQLSTAARTHRRRLRPPAALGYRLPPSSLFRRHSGGARKLSGSSQAPPSSMTRNISARLPPPYPGHPAGQGAAHAPPPLGELREGTHSLRRAPPGSRLRRDPNGTRSRVE